MISDEWVLIRYGLDPVTERDFLAPDRMSWVKRIADAWRSTLDEVEVEIQKCITNDFYDDEGNRYFPCPEDGVLRRRGVDFEADDQ